MAFFATNAGRQAWMRRMVGLDTNGDVKLRLFVNDVTPSDATVLANLTEMSTLGYAAKTLATGSFTVSLVSTTAKATYAQQVFSFTAGTEVTVYGAYITDAAGAILIGAERFLASITVSQDGDQINVTPELTLPKV